MHRIDHPTAVSVLPTPDPAGTPGYFTDGDPMGGIPATVVTRDWANAVQEEIANVIDAAGIPLDKTNNGQMAQAIAAQIAAATPDASESVKGIAKLATTAQAQALTDDTTIITPAKLADAFKGANQSFAANGYQKLPGGFILQWGLGSHSTQGQVFTFPISFPNGCLGVFAIDNSSTPTGTVTPGIGDITNAGFQLYGNPGLLSSFRWHAFGY